MYGHCGRCVEVAGALIVIRLLERSVSCVGRAGSGWRFEVREG